MSIQVNNLSKYFRFFKRDAGLKGAFKSFFNRKYENFYALKNISFDLKDGEILGILGENGAGKTTLIKLMVGLLYPSEGDIKVNGFSPWLRKEEFLKKISIVMGQKNQLWWEIPASESFLLNQKIYGIPDKKFNQILDELVELFDVQEKINVQVRRLSLGERMKMEIIAALLHNPKIVFLDEPTIGLDVISQSKIREFIKYYNQQYKTTFVITSHYMQDIEALCKRVLVVHKGASLYDGNFNDLVKMINPSRKLLFEFNSLPKESILNELSKEFQFNLIKNILHAELPATILNQLLEKLFKIDHPISLTLEDMPVEDTMRAFFLEPEKFLK